MKRAIGVVVLLAFEASAGAQIAEVEAEAGRGGSIRVVVSDSESGEGLVGVTVVASLPEVPGLASTVTEGGGIGILDDLAPGNYQVVFFFAASQITRSNVRVDRGTVAFVNVRFNTASEAIVCIFDPRPPVIDQETTSCTQSVKRAPPLNAGILSTLPLLSTRDGIEHRILGLALDVRERDLPRSMIYEGERIDAGAEAAVTGNAVGTLMLTPTSGSNETEHAAEVGIGTDRARAALASRGPIEKDKWWWAAGTSATKTADGWRVPAAAKLNYSHSPEHQGGAFLASSRSSSESSGAAVVNWRSTFSNAKRELKAAVGVSRRMQSGHNVAFGGPTNAASSSEPRDADHAGAKISLVERRELLGDHVVTATAESYLAREGGETRRLPEHAAALQDSWAPLPNLTINPGVRVESSERTLWMPRLGVVYDWTREGRSKVFGSLGRLARDGEPIDEAQVGFEYELVEDLVLGAALAQLGSLRSVYGIARARLTTLRAQIQLRGERGGSRVEAELEFRVFDDGGGALWLGTIVREGGRPGETTGSGGVVRWSHPRGMLSVALEATLVQGSKAGHLAAGYHF